MKTDKYHETWIDRNNGNFSLLFFLMLGLMMVSVIFGAISTSGEEVGFVKVNGVESKINTNNSNPLKSISTLGLFIGAGGAVLFVTLVFVADNKRSKYQW